LLACFFQIQILHKTCRRISNTSTSYTSKTAANFVVKSSNTSTTNTLVGLGIHHVTGYQFNRWIGAGMGIGFDGYDIGAGENIIPVYAEARGYFMKKNTTPFYSVALGYGFAGKNDNTGIIEGSGGIMFNPNIGYRIGASAGANFTLALGYKLQKASFTPRWNGEIERKFTYSRLNLKLGLLF